MIADATHSVNKQRQPPQQKMWPNVSFQYIGKTALTVTGMVTGRQYRFTAPGDRVKVDYRDAATMMNVPVLKRN
ncbi:MAG TPA: hypothetical protein PKV73_18075 [Agriterribacter sp.]|nr:hypothetical protein [Agriterribacter sp.]